MGYDVLNEFGEILEQLILQNGHTRVGIAKRNGMTDLDLRRLMYEKSGTVPMYRMQQILDSIGYDIIIDARRQHGVLSIR